MIDRIFMRIVNQLISRGINAGINSGGKAFSKRKPGNSTMGDDLTEDEANDALARARAAKRKKMERDGLL